MSLLKCYLAFWKWADSGVGSDTPSDGSQFDVLFSDGAQFKIGNLNVKVIHTPGHTPDSVSYYINDAIFVGDTIFMPYVGTARTDFPGGSAETLYHSIQKILALPDQTCIYTCHDYPPDGQQPAWVSTVAEQKKTNSMINDSVTESEFVTARNKKDFNKPVPKLLLSSIQVNLRAGKWTPSTRCMSNAQWSRAPILFINPVQRILIQTIGDLFLTSRIAYCIFIYFSLTIIERNKTMDGNRMKKTLLSITLMSTLIIPSVFGSELSKKNSCIEHIDEHYEYDLLLLSQCNIEDKDIKTINTFSKKHDVKRLFLDNNNISEVGATELSHNKTMDSLNISFNPIKDMGVIELAKNNTLKVLEVVSTQIGDKGIAALSRNKSLFYLGIGNDTFGLEGASEIANNTTLQALSITGNALDHSVIAELLKNSTLTALGFLEIKLSTKDLHQIAKMTGLRRFYIYSSDIGDQGAKIIASLPNLTNVILYNANVGSQGLTELAKNSKLFELELSNPMAYGHPKNHIQAKGLEGLINNTSLEYLGLANNYVDDQGATLISSLSSIRVLGLNDNNIGDLGAIALSQNNSLNYLDVSNNRIGQLGRDALEANTHIQLQMEGNKDDISASRFQSVLKRIRLSPYCKFRHSKLCMNA